MSSAPFPVPDPITRPMFPPEIIPPAIPEFDQATLGWYCLRSQPKRERIAVRTIRTLPNVRAFSTFFTYRKWLHDGRKPIGEPLFPNYVFVQCPFELTKQVAYCYGVARFVQRGDAPAEVPPAVIGELLSLAPYPQCAMNLADPEFCIGQNVRIIAGVFQNTEAKIVRLIPAKRRVELLIKLLGGEHVVPIELERIDDPTLTPRQRVLAHLHSK